MRDTQAKPPSAPPIQRSRHEALQQKLGGVTLVSLLIGYPCIGLGLWGIGSFGAGSFLFITLMMCAQYCRALIVRRVQREPPTPLSEPGQRARAAARLRMTAARNLRATDPVAAFWLTGTILPFLLAVGFFAPMSVAILGATTAVALLCSALATRRLLALCAQALPARHTPGGPPPPRPSGHHSPVRTGRASLHRPPRDALAARGAVRRLPGDGRMVRILRPWDGLPPLVMVEIELTGVEPELELRARQSAPDVPGIGDLILDRSISASGLPRATLLQRLGGLHQPLMTVFGEHPDAVLQDGVLQVRIDLGRTKVRDDLLEEVTGDSLQLAQALELRCIHTPASPRKLQNEPPTLGGHPPT